MRHYRFHVAVRCAVPTVATLLTSAEADGNAHTVATVETVERIIYVKDVVWVKQQYKLMYNEGYADYYGSDIVEIGKIVDTSLNEDVMFIYYEKELYKRTGCHTCIEEYEREGRDYPVAMVDDLHRPCLYQQPKIFLSLNGKTQKILQTKKKIFCLKWFQE